MPLIRGGKDFRAAKKAPHIAGFFASNKKQRRLYLPLDAPPLLDVAPLPLVAEPVPDGAIDPLFAPLPMLPLLFDFMLAPLVIDE